MKAMARLRWTVHRPRLFTKRPSLLKKSLEKQGRSAVQKVTEVEEFVTLS